MLRYAVMAVTDEECAKADADPNYSPQEYLLKTYVVETEREAETLFRKHKRANLFPASAQLVYVCHEIDAKEIVKGLHT